MKDNKRRKALIIGIIVLFIGSVITSVKSSNLNDNEICSKWKQPYRNPFFPKESIFNQLIKNKTTRNPIFNYIHKVGQCVQQTEDKGYILTGFKEEFSSNVPGSSNLVNTLLMKYDENGKKEWSETFEFMEGNMGHSVQQTEDHKFIIGGSTASSDKSYAMLMKIDEQGNEEWMKKYEGLGVAQGTVVQQTSDSGYILTGSSSPLGNTNISYVLLLKTDEDGNEKWNKTFEYRNSSIGSSVQQTEDYGYIITGYTGERDWTNPWGFWKYQILLVKTDANGNEEWYKTFDFLDSNLAYSIQQIDDKGYIICGSITSFDDRKSFGLLLKTYENGTEEWHKTFSNKYGYSVEQTEDKGYIIGGTAISQYNYYALLLKTDEQGNEEWAKTYPGLGVAQGTMVQQTVDNGYILTGTTSRSAYSMETYVLLLKTDEDGNLEWSSNRNKNNSTARTVNSFIIRFFDRFPLLERFLNLLLFLQQLLGV